MCTESCPPSCVCTSSRLIPPHSSPFLSFLSFLLLLPQVCRGARFRQRVCAGGRFKQRYHCLCVASAVHDAPAREGESVVRRVGLQRVSRCIWRLRFHIRRGHGHHCVGRRGVTLHLRGELCDYTPSRRPTACLSKENRTIIFVHTCEDTKVLTPVVVIHSPLHTQRSTPAPHSCYLSVARCSKDHRSKYSLLPISTSRDAAR